LVIAHPRWYPSLDDGTRRALLDFARAMTEPEVFDTDRALVLLGEGRDRVATDDKGRDRPGAIP